MSEITRILTAIEQGGARSTDELLPLVYKELRRLAAHKMANEPAGHTLQPTALVHEAWLQLVDTPNQSWQNRAHFFGAAAEAMRRILIARARRKGRQRRGSGAEHLDVDELEIAVSGHSKPASKGQMKTSHFESGIAHRAAKAALVSDVPTQCEPATFHCHPGGQ